MKKNVRDTSIDAYHDITKKKKITAEQKKIYDTIARIGRPVCNYELSAILKKPINEITPRVLELRAAKLVGCVGKMKGPTGRKVYHWTAFGRLF